MPESNQRNAINQNDQNKFLPQISNSVHASKLNLPSPRLNKTIDLPLPHQLSFADDSQMQRAKSKMLPVHI